MEKDKRSNAARIVAEGTWDTQKRPVVYAGLNACSPMKINVVQLINNFCLGVGAGRGPTRVGTVPLSNITHYGCGGNGRRATLRVGSFR